MFELPPINPGITEEGRGLVILETLRPDSENRFSWIFRDPVDVLVARGCDEVAGALAGIDRYAGDHYLAGYLSYELGYCLEERLGNAPTSGIPLIWLGVYRDAVRFDHMTGQVEGAGADEVFVSRVDKAGFEASDITLGMDANRYAERIARIKDYIASGDVYQVNFTTKYCFGFHGSAYGLYDELKKKQEVPYSAFIRTDDGLEVLSISPELFFRREGGLLSVKPMKGTAPRGRTEAEDRVQAGFLGTDPKNRAENVMIVDLMRNDLGRISKTGGVSVTELFSVERYETLFQMTSTVKAELRPDIRWSEIIQCLFPSGSVTGAPKIRAMEIIRELEDGPRGVYTGAVGMIAPNGRGVFNVPIRTVAIRDGLGEMGVGSGIVADSSAEAEYEECKLKAAFLIDRPRVFRLIETMLWDGGYPRLSLHIERLMSSARYFDFRVDRDAVIKTLGEAGRGFDQALRYRVRLLVGRDGDCTVEPVLMADQSRWGDSVALSSYRTSRRDVFLFHKTTERAAYDAEYRKWSALGYADVLFLNGEGELTEGAISNVYIKKDGVLYTPPLDCGLLEGVMRRELLDSGQCEERVLHEADLRGADEVWLSNAVRGLYRVRLSA